MINQPESIRPFIGAKDFDLSRSFYRDIGFQEIITSPKMSYFHIDSYGFYLQDYWVKDWIDNSMVFLEINDLEATRQQLHAMDLPKKYPTVRLSEIVQNEWGQEFFLHDPSGVLWHYGRFRDDQ